MYNNEIKTFYMYKGLPSSCEEDLLCTTKTISRAIQSATTATMNAMAGIMSRSQKSSPVV